MCSSAAISLIVAYVPFSNFSRHRKLRAIALIIALSTRQNTLRSSKDEPSGASTTFRPPLFLIEIGTLTVIVRPSLFMLGFAITLPSGRQASPRSVPRSSSSTLQSADEYARLGLAEILAIKDGKPIFLEVKSEAFRSG